TITEASIQRPSERWRNTGSVDAASDSFGDRPDRIRRALRGDLDNIVLTALARDPQARYASVAALAEDLRRHLEKLPIKARAATQRYRLARFIQRNKPAVAGLTAFIGLLSVSIIVLSMQAAELADERDKALEASQTARVEAEKAVQVTDFLVQLFEAADPAQSLGIETPVGELLERGQAEIDALDEQPTVKAEMLRVMAEVSASLGEYQRAGMLLEQAVTVLENARNVRGDEMAKTLYTQAANLLKLGQYQAAEDTAERATHISDGSGSEVGDRARAVMADAQQMTGRLDVARGTLEKLIKDRGDANSDAFDATLARSLGIVFARQSQMTEATAQFRRALAIRRELHGPEHPETTSALGNLGTALMQSGHNREGMAVASEALEIETRLLGPDHPELAHWLHQLGSANRELGELEAAENYHRRALALRQSAFGDEHPETIGSLYSLATVLSDRGEHRQARTLIAEVLQARRRQFGPRHALIANTLHASGVIEGRLERLEQAKQLLEEALEMRLEMFGDDHIHVAHSYLALSRLALDEGRDQDCRMLLEKAERIALGNAAPEHPIFESISELSLALNETSGG
ncbi:MAG TPA: tetratricopeptide repeat protein, partial [Wenzhouxiangellaceae bacterium]|nr:tetratricopeptide repeat protein [Wenzhouxiangellaceae bacterium]